MVNRQKKSSKFDDLPQKMVKFWRFTEGNRQILTIYKKKLRLQKFWWFTMVNCQNLTIYQGKSSNFDDFQENNLSFLYIRTVEK